MLLELETALRFLKPQKKQLARTLISISSLGVVSVITWLVVVFYSVTEGLEKRWINQLVQVTGTLRVMPTDAYFESPDFLIDSYLEESGYQPSTLIDKIESPFIDNEIQKESLPNDLQVIDPLSWTRPSYRVWQKLQSYNPLISLSSPVQLSLSQFRQRAQTPGSFFISADEYKLQQSAYLLGFYPDSQTVEKLIAPTDSLDWHTFMITLGQRELQEPWPSLEKWFSHFKPVKSSWGAFQIPVCQSQEYHQSFSVITSQDWNLIQASFPTWNKNLNRWVHQALIKHKSEQKASHEISVLIPAGFINFDNVSASAWSLSLFEEDSSKWIPLLAAKSLKDAGLRMGSNVTIQKEIQGPLGTTLHKQEGLVIGFYDSGLIPLGGRFFITNSSNVLPLIEPAQPSSEAQFFQAWPKDATSAAQNLRVFLKEENLSSFFTVQSYEDFEASYDLLTQLRSDRLLLSLIAFIILIVASSSVCTMMVLLVNERRKEIAVLKTLGMSSFRLCSCFALCGLFLGFIGAFVGLSLAFLTLQNLDSLIGFISYLQGSPLLNPAYYGKHLPNEMSLHAVKMAVYGNTFLAFIGSALAAWQTSKLTPPDLFRSL